MEACKGGVTVKNHYVWVDGKDQWA